MKKSKILAVFGILLAMGITACGGGNNDSGDAKSQDAPKTQESAGGDESQPASDHKHSYGEWKQTKAPTCTEKGEEERVCECGEKQTRSVNALGHDWGEWAVKTAATCTVDGEEERACKRCGEKEKRAVKAAHDWDAAQDVAAGEDPANQVGYKLANCKNNDAIKIEIKATDAKFYKGSIKSGTPSGYFKLGSTNDQAYWKFTLAGTKMYKGMLYQRGAMDQFSGNTERTYAQTSTSGDHAPKYPLGNFDAVVNGDSLDKSQWIDTPYSELLADGEDSSAMGENYSPICLVPIGECVVQAGLNEITYKRLGSYNLIISELVFIGSEFEHVHAAAETWSSDDNQHWHACTALGCPTGKADAPANHTFGEWEVTKAATCKEAGERQHACTVCGKVVKEAVEKLPHTLGEAYDVVPATCEAAGSQKKKCSVCEEVITEVLPKADHKFGDAEDSYAAGEGYIATTAHNCSVCGKSALRWSSRSYDETLSNGGSKVTVDGIDGVKTGDAENDGGQGNANPAVKVGNHFVYKVKVNEAVEKAGLAFKVKTRAANKAAPVFKTQTSDGKRGNYYDEATQKFTPAPARYGVRINGAEVYFNEEILAKEENAPAAQILWFNFPLNDFSLIAGINTVDVYCMGGYSMDAIFEFQLTGLPHVTSSHTHTLGDWQSDDNNHWKLCSAAGCPAGEGAHLQEAAHDWVAGLVTVNGTKATQVLECSVCHKTSSISGGAYGTFAWKDALQGAGTVGSDGKVSAGDNNLLVFEVPAAGTYVVTLQMQGSKDNEAKVLNGDGHGYAIYANGVKGTFLGEGKTYAEFFGADQTAWVDLAFGEVELVKGKNEIKVSALSSYYRTRINPNSNVTIAPKA